jgi:hypothetical protein
LPADKYITASCQISKHVVYKNNLPVFEQTDSDFSGFLETAYRHFNLKYPKFHKMDRLCQLGLLASEVLLEGNFNREKYPAGEVGIVLSNASASLDTDLRYANTMSAIPSPALFVYTLPNIMIGEICIRNGFKGENAFFVFNAFDATFMEQYVSHLLDNQLAQACICGWVELLKEEYSANLMLVEKDQSGKSLFFTKENILKTDSLDHG